jgi:hypothetical protein
LQFAPFPLQVDTVCDCRQLEDEFAHSNRVIGQHFEVWACTAKAGSQKLKLVKDIFNYLNLLESLFEFSNMEKLLLQTI